MRSRGGERRSAAGAVDRGGRCAGAWHPAIPTLLLVALTPFGCTRQGALEAKLDEQQRRIEALTAQVEDLRSRLADAASGDGGPAEGAGSVAITGPDADRAAVVPRRLPSDPGVLQKRIDALLVDRRVDDARRMVAAFNDAHVGTPARASTRSLTRELTVIGRAAPADWRIDRWLQGAADVRLDGIQPTVLVFWEPWCEQCREALPRLQAVHDGYRSRGWQFVGVTRMSRGSTRESAAAVAAAVAFPLAREDGGLTDYFDVTELPAAAIVSGGRIVWRGDPARLTPVLLEGFTPR